jgi:hypothetical protein
MFFGVQCNRSATPDKYGTCVHEQCFVYEPRHVIFLLDLDKACMLIAFPKDNKTVAAFLQNKKSFKARHDFSSLGISNF